MKGTVGELGEFGLIRELTSRLTTTPAVRLGPGDDAAVVDRARPQGGGQHGHPAGGTALPARLVDGVRRRAARPPRRTWPTSPPWARCPPRCCSAWSYRPNCPVTWPTELMDGIRDECQVAGAAVVGGDVVRGDTITVAITALGDLRNHEPVTRAGAQPGDVVAVTGWLGWSAAGLRGALARLPLAARLRRGAPPPRTARTTRAPRRPGSAPPP